METPDTEIEVHKEFVKSRDVAKTDTDRSLLEAPWTQACVVWPSIGSKIVLKD